MKKIFKFIIILFCIWAGTKSILEVGRGEDSILSFVIDMGIFILLVGSTRRTIGVVLLINHLTNLILKKKIKTMKIKTIWQH